MVGEELFPRPGELVLVPWGLEEMPGVVIEVFATGLGERAVVRLLGENDPDATVTVPADSLTPASGISRGISSRIDTAAFESQVRAAIRRAATELHVEIDEEPSPDREADVVLNNGPREIEVQIKYFSMNRLSTDTISAVAGYASATGRPTIIVANAGLTKQAENRLRYLNSRRQSAWFIRWTGSPDYERLRSTIQEALTSSR
jgi:hypothetical protein